MSAAPDLQKLKKRLVVCLDGTWNDADNVGTATNVSRMARAIHATTGTGGVLQSVLYLRGVGTSGLDITRKFDGATGFGIDENIRSAYMFLAQNYVPGDEIFLFGFSRGAFTARSLVGLIGATGLLKRQSLENLGRAWLYYRNEKRPHSPEAFKKYEPNADVHTGVEIQFLGVWDTVGSVGFPGHLFDQINHQLYGFHDTELCPIVRHAYHALAIDEHRDTFVPTFWTGDAPGNCQVEQVWFAGAHADVGGGYLEHELSNIPLIWMAQKAEVAGLAVDWPCLPTDKVDPHAARHDSSSGLFLYNRLVPTLREICGQAVKVPLYQRLYTPIGADHRPLKPLNEAVHQSVMSRFGHTASFCVKPGGHDDKAEFKDEHYAPVTVGALFDQGGALRQGITVSQ